MAEQAQQVQTAPASPAEKKAAPAPAKNGGGKKKVGTVSLVGFFILMVAVLFLPTTIILMAGMMPTLVAAWVTRVGRREKIITVGAMNLAGCVPFLLPLWASDHTVNHAFHTLMNLSSLIVMYCGAGIGYLIGWAMAGIVNALMIQGATGRLADIRKRKAALAERWGPEVTGDMVLNAQGFAAEPKGEADAKDND